MDRSRIGGGFLTAVGVLAPAVSSMMGLTVSAPVGWALLGIFAVMTVVGVALMFWPKRQDDPPIDLRDTAPASAAFDIEGGSDISVEDSRSTAEVFARVRDTKGFSARNVRHEPPKAS